MVQGGPRNTAPWSLQMGRAGGRDANPSRRLPPAPQRAIGKGPAAPCLPPPCKAPKKPPAPSPPGPRLLPGCFWYQGRALSRAPKATRGRSQSGSAVGFGRGLSQRCPQGRDLWSGEGGGGERMSEPRRDREREREQRGRERGLRERRQESRGDQKQVEGETGMQRSHLSRCCQRDTRRWREGGGGQA